MKRFFTPFFIMAMGAMLICIYLLIIDETGWGTLGAVLIGILAFAVFLIDFFLKKAKIGLRKIFLIQLGIIGVVIFVYHYGTRIQTLKIPDNFDREYVSIVYGVENENKLYNNPFTWSKTIEIPENGILLTSSDFNTNLHKTEMRFSSGIMLGSEQTDKHLVDIGNHEFEIDNKEYIYRSWKIQKGFCCTYTSNEIKERAKELITEINRRGKANK